MPIARSPGVSPTRTRTNPTRAAKSKYQSGSLDDPPAVSTPTHRLAQEPPATPFGASQAPAQVHQARASSEQSLPDSDASSNEDTGDATLLMAREGPQGRSSHSSSDPALVKILQIGRAHV